MRGSDKQSFLNKGKDTQGSLKAVSPWWLLIDIKSTVNVIINKELVKYIHYAHGWFVCVHSNSKTRIIMTESTFPGFVTVWFGERCIMNILYLLKSKNNYRIIYDSAEGK